MKEIESKIFGTTKLLEEKDKDLDWLKALIDAYPVNTFGLLSKKLNSLGYLLSIGTL